MKEISKEEQKKIASELSEWIGERIGCVDSFILFTDLEDQGVILHSEKMNISKMADALAWLAISISQGLKNGH